MKKELLASQTNVLMEEIRKIQFPRGWNNDVIEKVINHFKYYRLENGHLHMPQKGLFLVSKYEDEPIFLYKILCFALRKLYNDSEKNDYYQRVQDPNKIKPLLVTPNELRRELFQEKKPNELLKKHLHQKILFIENIGIEKTIKLDNYNEFDIIPELIEKQYLSQRLNPFVAPLYVISYSTTAQLKDRYSKQSIFQLSRITEGVFISSPKANNH